MLNTTHKASSYRLAIAQAIVAVSRMETIHAIRDRRVPKGDVFEFSRAAGLLAVKKTCDRIPDCYRIPVEYTNIRYQIEDLTVLITVEVHTLYKTGVDLEAMHGATVSALTLYDMLKPIDKEVAIHSVKLLEEKGGTLDYGDNLKGAVRCAVIVCSDSISSGSKPDRAGKAVMEKLERMNRKAVLYEMIPDDPERIRQRAIDLSNEGFHMVLFTGGTGLSKRDITPEAIQPLLQREVPGIMEAARAYGQQRTPYSMLSRGVAGFIGQTLVLTLPGSTRGATETMDALFPHLLHAFTVAGGLTHDE